MKVGKNKYDGLLKEIQLLVEQARHRVARQINTELLFTNWHMDRLIVEKKRSEQYTETSVREMLLDNSKDLTRDLGKGFSPSQLIYMRLSFLPFPIFEEQSKPGVTLSHQKKAARKIGLTVSNQLSWSRLYLPNKKLLKKKLTQLLNRE